MAAYILLDILNAALYSDPQLSSSRFCSSDRPNVLTRLPVKPIKFSRRSYTESDVEGSDAREEWTKQRRA